MYVVTRKQMLHFRISVTMHLENSVLSGIISALLIKFSFSCAVV